MGFANVNFGSAKRFSGFSGKKYRQNFTGWFLICNLQETKFKLTMKRRLLLLGTLLVSVVFVSAQVSVTVDPRSEKGTISPYIYGQFIEHLGRCIYGGLWAEMLEDRKFYYPVTDQYAPWGTASDAQWKAGEFKHLAASPWRVIGNPGSVSMDRKAPYTGAHTPVVTVSANQPAGIGQPMLTIEKGRQYQGYVALRGENFKGKITGRVVSPDGKTLFETDFNFITEKYVTYTFSFTAKSSAEPAELQITGNGNGRFWIGTVSLMPADNLKGWRRDVVALLKELNAPVYRWPGGNFVSGYNWRDGIGPRDLRPPRKNPAWTGIEPNDVGIHEYMELMEMIGAEPFIAVNTGLGTVQEVAEEVQYCNGPADSPQGVLRAQNGHPEPYRVKWWAVGNEMYGNWQLGHMPLSEYVKKHNRVAETMRAVDPTICLIGVGSTGEWSRTMLKECSDYMELLSEHIYSKDLPDVTAHTRQLAGQIRQKAAEHRKYMQEIPGVAPKNIRIAMDEWNYWYGDYRYGELGVRYHLKDALGVATGLHEFFRNNDVYFMANYAQTVNVIGCIKTTPTTAFWDATGLPLKLYRKEFGTIPVSATGETSNLDLFAAKTADGKAVTLAVVNPTGTAVTLKLQLKNGKLPRKAAGWIIAGDDPEMYNSEKNPENLTIRKQTAQKLPEGIAIPAWSISVYKITL